MNTRAGNEQTPLRNSPHALSLSQVLWIIPQRVVRWVLVMIALGISGSVLAMTFWPAVREDNRRVALATIVTIMLLHVLLSVGCLAYFFDAPEMDHLPAAITTPNQTVAATKSS